MRPFLQVILLLGTIRLLTDAWETLWPSLAPAGLGRASFTLCPSPSL